jgi:hypothetical protein
MKDKPSITTCPECGNTMYHYKTLDDGRWSWICRKRNTKKKGTIGCGHILRDDPKPPHRPKIEKVKIPKKLGRKPIYPQPPCPIGRKDCKLRSNGKKNWNCRTDRGGCGHTEKKIVEDD